MRTIFKLIFFFNAVLLMAGGGPYSQLKIVNLSGENISFSITFSSDMRSDDKIYTNLKEGKHNLSVSASEPHPWEDIFPANMHFSDMHPTYKTYINSLEIFDKNNKLIFNKTTYTNKRSLIFVRDRSYDEYLKNENHGFGTYYIVILKTDLDRNGIQSSHRTTERLNLREWQGTKGPVKKVINKGEAVAVTSIGEEYENGKHWVKIKLRDGMEGWGVATYLTPIQ